jgi:Flp pilus assembly pilin Flp
MIKLIKNFRKDEDGAVTVDWVVLTALIVGLAVAAFSGIEGGVTGLTADILAYLNSIDVG